MNSFLWVVGPLVGYLLGAIPFGLLIGLSKGVDIRKVGSGNIGATNLGRTLGKRYFWYAFFLDALKGFAPVLAVNLLAQRWGFGQWLPLLTALSAILGHVFPLYLRFKGGKGVATSFGVVLGIWPIFTLAGLGAGILFVLVLIPFRFISLSSITASLGFLALVWLLGRHGSEISSRLPRLTSQQFGPLLMTAGLFSFLIIIKHRTNIGRLMAGTEPKVGQGRKEAARDESDSTRQR